MWAVVDAVRQPAYTGENRCWPCTLVNGAIAVVAAVVVGVVAPVGTAWSVVLAAAVLLISVGLIGLRGYLVPGTPWLTETYLPDWFLRYFEHESNVTPEASIDPAAVLLEAGVVEECADVDDLCLEPAFRAAWNDRIDAIVDTDSIQADLASVLDLPADALSLERHGSAFVASARLEAIAGMSGQGTQRVGQWESEGAFLADVAAAGLLATRSPGWESLSPTARGQVLNGLRLFLETCPSCGGEVSLGEESVESCCRSREVVAVTCQACGERLFEADRTAVAG